MAISIAMDLVWHFLHRLEWIRFFAWKRCERIPNFVSFQMQIRIKCLEFGLSNGSECLNSNEDECRSILKYNFHYLSQLGLCLLELPIHVYKLQLNMPDFV